MNPKVQTPSKQIWAPIALAAITCLATWIVHWGSAEQTEARTQGAQNGWSWMQPEVGRTPGPEALPGSGQALVRPPHVLRAVLNAGSFAGTSPRGSWCANHAGVLAPCQGLRDRFEYHINGLGEISEAEVRALIEDEARRDVGDRLAQQIMAIYDRYWAVRNHPLRLRIDMSDPGTWIPALHEVQAVRREGLGEAWAQAFYAEEEQELISVHARVAEGSAPPTTHRDPVPAMVAGQSAEALRADRTKRYGEEIALELESLDAKQQAFDSGIRQARAVWQSLMSQGHLSDKDRQTQLQAFVDATFEPIDRRRAMTLATLSSP